MINSKQLFQAAQQYIPGGVNSPVRAFKSVGGAPRFIKKGHGAYLVDADDREYIDYVCSWGPLILGHAHPVVVERVTQALQSGFSFGAPTAIEVMLAQKVTELMPTIEMVRFVSSGTEAAMSALRLARGYTKRDKIIKFAGCYHGHADSLLVSAGSGVLTLNVQGAAGVPDSLAQHTLLAEFNDLQQVEELFKQHGQEIASVIVEPVACNMNCVLPLPGFLKGLRKLCDDYGALLIFDEVITGFRIGLGGAQDYYDVKPDLTVLGKIIGGGFPVGAFGGRREIMQGIAPLGPIYQAGTLSGNPIAMTSGLATLDLISEPHFYDDLAVKTEKLVTGFNEAAQKAQIPFHAKHIGSLFGLFFSDNQDIRCEKDVKQCNLQLFNQFFHAMLAEGIYLAPSAFEVGFLSYAHGEEEIQKTILAAERVFKDLSEKN